MTAIDGREDTEEITLDEEEWPVAEHYRVDPPTATPTEPRDADAAATTVLAREPVAARRRRLPPPFDDEPLALALFALLAAVVIAAVAVWYVTREDDAGATTRTTEQAPGGDATTPAPTTSEPTSPGAPTRPDVRPVPDLTGVTLEEARTLLEGAGLRIRVRRAQSDRPPGEVLRQLPAGRSEIADGGLVTLTVSSGPDSVAVAGVVGEEATAASSLLQEAGLVVEIERIASSRPAGTVLRQAPAAGTEVDEGTTVRLQVAKPREPSQPQTLDVPRLTGLDVADARTRLRDLGLRSTVTRIDSNRPEGTIVDQDPGAGTAVERGGTVALTVSSGPAAVPVPDVVGLDEESARAQLESAGFEVRTIDEPTDDPTSDGVVVGQSPGPGAQRRPGSVVTLRIARLA